MTTYSVMCDHCETMFEFVTGETIKGFINTHHAYCKGPLHMVD